MDEIRHELGGKRCYRICYVLYIKTLKKKTNIFSEHHFSVQSSPKRFDKFCFPLSIVIYLCSNVYLNMNI